MKILNFMTILLQFFNFFVMDSFKICFNCFYVDVHENLKVRFHEIISNTMKLSRPLFTLVKLVMQCYLSNELVSVFT